ncbi:hypothetical protein LINGRAHAP2_LOCUS22904 [Linum grandiflorum]
MTTAQRLSSYEAKENQWNNWDWNLECEEGIRAVSEQFGKQSTIWSINLPLKKREKEKKNRNEKRKRPSDKTQVCSVVLASLFRWEKKLSSC